MGAFENFINAEIALRTGIVAVPTADRYPRFTGVGRAVEQRTPAQVRSDIGAASDADLTDHITDTSDPHGDSMSVTTMLVTPTVQDASGALILDSVKDGSESTVTITNSGTGDHVAVAVNGDLSVDGILQLEDLKSGTDPWAFFDGDRNLFMKAYKVADAVNFFAMYNAATGDGPIWKAIGNDPNVDMNLATQGTGKVKANGNIIYHVSGTDVAIGDGGTGQSTKTAAFDALSPTTTKGDIVASDGSNNVRKAAGSDGQVLIADDSQSDGLVWEDDIRSWPVEIPSPATDDEYLIRSLPYNVTFTEVYHHIVEGTGTVSFDIIRRSRSSSGTGGTDITSSPMQATTTGTSVTSFANSGDGDANEWLILKVTATTGSPEKLRLEYRHKRRK
jgi:hypothetical protein